MTQIGSLDEESFQLFYDYMLDNYNKPLTKDMIMEVTCTMSEEGLGPLKWWKETKL